MEVSNRAVKIACVVLLALLLVGVGFGVVTKLSYDAELARLRNEVASRDQTIEIQAGAYSRLALESQQLEKLLGESSAEVGDLLKRLDKTNEDILAANRVAIHWKQAYEALIKAHQEPVPGPTPEDPARQKVSFTKDFGPYRVSGHTLTDPAEALLRLEQIEPLRLTIFVTQDPTGAWKSYATSSDENHRIEIEVAGVNPRVIEPKWFEHIQFSATIAGGQMGAGFGALAGLGVSYKVKQFDIGPAVFVGIGDRVDKFVGATVTWRPFEK